MIPLTGPVLCSSIYYEYHKENPTSIVDISVYSTLFEIPGRPVGFEEFRGKRVIRGECNSWNDPNGDTVITSSIGSRIMRAPGPPPIEDLDHEFFLVSDIVGFEEDPSIAVRIRWSNDTMSQQLNDDGLSWSLILDYIRPGDAGWTMLFEREYPFDGITISRTFYSGFEDISLTHSQGGINLRLRLLVSPSPSVFDSEISLVAANLLGVEMASISTNNGIVIINPIKNQWIINSLIISKGALGQPIGLTDVTWGIDISHGYTWSDPVIPLFDLTGFPDGQYPAVGGESTLGIQTRSGASWNLSSNRTWITSNGVTQLNINGSGVSPPLYEYEQIFIDENEDLSPRSGVITLTSTDDRFDPISFNISQASSELVPE